MSSDEKRLALCEPLANTKTLVKKLARSACVSRRAVNEERWRRGPLMSAAERLAETLAALMEDEDDDSADGAERVPPVHSHEDSSG